MGLFIPAAGGQDLRPAKRSDRPPWAWHAVAPPPLLSPLPLFLEPLPAAPVGIPVPHDPIPMALPMGAFPPLIQRNPNDLIPCRISFARHTNWAEGHTAGVYSADPLVL